MPRYLFLMRGDQSSFEALDEAGRAGIVAEHVAYSRSLEERGILRDGDGIAPGSRILAGSGTAAAPSPYARSPHELSGFYVVEAASMDEALAIAKGCPALRHGESVEVAELGH